MTTIIRQYGSPAAFSDSIILDLEPAITFPTGVLGAYRLSKSLPYSQAPRVGGWPAYAESTPGTKVYTGRSVQIAGASLALSGILYPAEAATQCVVFRQDASVASGEAKFLGGVIDSSVLFGLTQDPDGTLGLRWGRGAGTAGQASIAISGGTRWEMVFQRIDRLTGEAVIYRPRDENTATGSFTPGALEPAGGMRLLGATAPASVDGAVEAAWSVWWSRKLSKVEMDALYASAKASLIVSGIEI